MHVFIAEGVLEEGAEGGGEGEARRQHRLPPLQRPGVHPGINICTEKSRERKDDFLSRLQMK